MKPDKKKKEAQTEYETAVKSLQDFCDKNTGLTPIVMDSEYPIRVQFIPDNQLSMFEDEENINENGEFNDLTVSVGLTTSVKSTLKFKMDSKLLKKLIKLAETVGTLYYHAFRATEGEKLTPSRPVILINDEENVKRCPCCEKPVAITEGEGALPAFCQWCGQSLDWTPEPINNGSIVSTMMKEFYSPELLEAMKNH